MLYFCVLMHFLFRGPYNREAQPYPELKTDSVTDYIVMGCSTLNNRDNPVSTRPASRLRCSLHSHEFLTPSFVGLDFARMVPVA